MNLPLFYQLKNSKNILIAGAGGGFDIFAGLPLFYQLNKKYKCHLFNYSFTNLNEANSETKVYEPNYHLYGFSGKVLNCPVRKNESYFPEGYLAEVTGRTVWATEKVGVVPLRKALQRLVDLYNIDTIIMIDGGVDSLMHGDETECGSILEDTVSLASLKDINNIPNKILATVGFGTEIEDHLDHYLALSNIAELIKLNGLIGSCCLIKEDQSFNFMKNAYEYVVNISNHAKSHITPRIISAVEGNFINNQHYFIQPLMNLYWFWKPEVVISQNKLIDKTFCSTNTFTDVNMVYRQKLNNMSLRKRPAKGTILGI